jgi:hypothetical protein
MRKLRLSPGLANTYGVDRMLVDAPKKERKKYGKRRDVEIAERTLTNRERNREHAKSTRLRKKVFQKVSLLLFIRLMTQ